jgi:hypothetical protein
MRALEFARQKHSRGVGLNKQEQLDELTFKGSECTRDCSGHLAGYNWSRQKNGRIPNSHSPSFNKGASLQRAGK